MQAEITFKEASCWQRRLSMEFVHNTNTGDSGYGGYLPETIQQLEEVDSHFVMLSFFHLVCIMHMSWQKLGSTSVPKLQKSYARSRTSNV